MVKKVNKRGKRPAAPKVEAVRELVVEERMEPEPVVEVRREPTTLARALGERVVVTRSTEPAPASATRRVRGKRAA